MKIIDYLKRQSTKVKATFAVFGVILISVGYIIRPIYPVYGFVSTFSGLCTDIGIMFILYLEIQDIRNEVESAQDRIEKAQDRIEEAQDRIDENFDEIDDLRWNLNI
jgi:hypothetical protein